MQWQAGFVGECPCLGDSVRVIGQHVCQLLWDDSERKIAMMSGDVENKERGANMIKFHLRGIQVKGGSLDGSCHVSASLKLFQKKL